MVRAVEGLADCLHRRLEWDLTGLRLLRPLLQFTHADHWHVMLSDIAQARRLE